MRANQVLEAHDGETQCFFLWWSSSQRFWRFPREAQQLPLISSSLHVLLQINEMALEAESGLALRLGAWYDTPLCCDRTRRQTLSALH